MDKFSIISFFAKYVICIGLLYYIYKKKKTLKLYSSVVSAFIVLSLIVLLNFILSDSKTVSNDRPFYDIQFIDFLVFILLISAFYKDKTTTKQELDDQQPKS
jgi:hypothetical protein